MSPLHMTDDGVECSPDAFSCRQEKVALAMAKAWIGLALTYRLPIPKTSLYLNLWKVGSSTSLGLQTTPQALFHVSREFREGEWLQHFLCSATSRLKAEACLYGDEERIYEPIEAATLRTQLLNGLLRYLSGPILCMISRKLISDEEARKLTTEVAAASELRYFSTPDGYHVFSNLIPQNPIAIEEEREPS